MKPLPPQMPDEDINFSRYIINTIIDHLTEYEAEQDRRYKELDNRIQRIANNQLKMKRGEVPAFECNDCAFGKPCAKHSAPEQPKRWRAEEYGQYWYVDSEGDFFSANDYHTVYEDYRYAIGNYHQTREQAIAYKARLLELDQQV